MHAPKSLPSPNRTPCQCPVRCLPSCWKWKSSPIPAPPPPPSPPSHSPVKTNPCSQTPSHPYSRLFFVSSSSSAVHVSQHSALPTPFPPFNLLSFGQLVCCPRAAYTADRCLACILVSVLGASFPSFLQGVGTHSGIGGEHWLRCSCCCCCRSSGGVDPFPYSAHS